MEKIPVTIPLMGDEEEQAAAEVIRSGWLTQGPKTAAFEKAVAEYVNAGFAVASSSCTTSLVLALEAAGVRPGDEVITTPYSFIATANAITAVGGVPVFADIDLPTYNLDAKSTAAKITDRTRCLMPVHQVGLPADIDAFRALAQENGLALIEDAACALGSEYRDRPVGGRTDKNHAACFSFHPRKLITTGEGGMITTDDEELAHRAKTLSAHGATVSETQKHASTQFLPPTYPVRGYNYRLSDVLAAIGLVQMNRLGDILLRRRALADRYDQAFRDYARIVTPFTPTWANPNRQSYQIRIDGADASERNRMVDDLRQEGVMVTPGVADIHRQKYYYDLMGPQDLPNTEIAADTTIILPLFPQMADADLDRAAEAIIKICS